MLIKKILERSLKWIATLVLKFYQPKVIVITGTVGKTSTKEAIWCVLKEKFNVLKTKENYNNEIGVPLSILECENPQRNIFGWIKVFLKGISLIIKKRKNFPQIFVLEIASNKPGDLKYLMEMIPKKNLQVAVLTAVSPVHLQFFKNLENIFREKITPFFYLPPKGIGIVNNDECDVNSIREITKKQILTYGILKNSDVKAKNIQYSQDGINFKIDDGERRISFFFKEGVSFYQIYPILAGFLVGKLFNLSSQIIIKGLKNYHLLPGRMKKIKGKKESLILDDTYNASPEAMKKALKTLANFPQSARKIAILGDMLELGEKSSFYHQEIGEFLAKLDSIDYLITLGEEGKRIAQGAEMFGFPSNKIFIFQKIEDLNNFLKKFIEKRDVILVKGSRGMKMEKIVKELIK